MSNLSIARQRVPTRPFRVAARRWLAAMASLWSTGLITPAAAAEEPPKVLLVVSSEGRLDAAGKQQRPDFEMDELAQAWLVLRANGLRVELASPTGGALSLTGTTTLTTASARSRPTRWPSLR